MSDDNPNPPSGDGEPGKGEQTFTQSDVDRIVKKKAEELYRRRLGDVDIDDLKAKAGQIATAEERIALLEREVEASKREALRRRVQAAHGISDEDADLFLTGGDEQSLTAQAKRLAERTPERKNHVPREGNNHRPSSDPMREFARDLFGRATAD